MKWIMGGDIFVILLLVFIMATGVLLQNTNRAGDNPETAHAERSMPKIQLPDGTSEGLARVEPKNTVTVSAKKSKDGINYFINDREIDSEGLLEHFKKRQVSTVKVRFDKEMPYGSFVKLLDQCQKAGVENVYSIYTLK